MSDDGTTDRAFSERQRGDAADLYSLLSNEDRIEILMALAEALQPSDHETFGFNEFWAEVDIRDSGRFNYHLNQLRDTFIRETDDGYSLTYTGAITALLLHSGKLTRNPTVEFTDIDVECPRCGGSLSVGYRDKLVIIECDACEAPLSKMQVPPGCADAGSTDHLLRSSTQFALREVIALRDGTCPNCGGIATPEIVPPEERRRDSDIPTVFYRCEDCIYFFRTGIRSIMVTHPAVVSFCHDHGLDVLAPDSPEVFIEMHDERTVSVRSRDPWRFEFAIERDGETLTMVLDEDLDVIESRVVR